MNSSNRLVIIILTALAILTILSLVPWNNLTGHTLKDFNLIGDILPQTDKTYITHEEIDSELNNLTLDSDSIQTSTDSEASTDSIITLPNDFQAPCVDGVILFEDYSTGKSSFSRLHSILSQSNNRAIRIAMVGDSYIEGDILAQDIRSALQTTYGGRGVGYMPIYSPIPGFRKSINQSGSGWTETEIRKMSHNDLRILQGMYFTGESGAQATFRGSKRIPHTDRWSQSTIMFIAPTAGNISITYTDNQIENHAIAASPDVQCITVNAETSNISFSSDIAGLKVLGAWLSDNTGIVFDTMSLRGNSGISHRNLNSEIISQMRRTIDYDVVILEFGINALTSTQHDYTAYKLAMVQTVNTIKHCYPNAVIIIMGIGDRGQKQGTEVKSIGTAGAMVTAQRDVARLTGSVFWDTRAAMGGNDAIVDWRNRGLVNSDYIHLNHKGGTALADIFMKSFNKSVNE